MHKIVILGGDLRFQYLKDELIKEYDTTLFLSEKDSFLTDITNCRFLILPLPCTIGNSTVLNSLGNPDLKDIFPHLSKNTTILAGKVYDELNSLAKEYGIEMVDYYTEEFEMLNAIPSAEGAIEIAIKETPFTLCGSNIFVLGFGRIGKTLSKMLSGLGALVTVCARRKESLALAKALGFKTQSISDLLGICDADIIFNTIPSLILDCKNLSDVKKDALIIDLASKPGGVDFDFARGQNIKAIHALGLPAKTAFKTSSRILSECICSLIEERRTNGT